MKLSCAQALLSALGCATLHGADHHIHAILTVVQKLLLPQKPEIGLELLINCKGSNH